MTTGCAFLGRARLRCDNSLVNAATGKAVARGYTIHAFTDPSGRVIRPPAWFVEALAGAAHGGCDRIQQAG
jgi:acyl-CoA thioesterase FadM